ncbi:MAG: hypothetical protein PHS60_00325 [Zavarzinia sp.]|nr:hypothetical protein [Zavarzinia sp.]
MRAILPIAFSCVAVLALAGCDTIPGSSASAEAPHAMTGLPGDWQVGASEMHDAEGRAFTVCTLLRSAQDGRRFWIAATPSTVSGDLYLGVRSPELPAIEGRADRKALVTVDGIAYRPMRAQQAGDALSMAIAPEEAPAFLDAFAKGYQLAVTAGDLPGFSIGVDLRGSANGRREWKKCIERELKPAS